jgi:hypothetical protein
MIFRPNFLWGFGIPPSCVTQTHSRFFDDSVLLRIGFFEQGMLAHSRPEFGPSDHLFRASSAFKLFEAGLRSLESPFSGQQCLQVIRGWTSVPRITFFGPAVPSSYSRPDFGPSNRLFRASSAFKLFEAGLRSLESPFSGQQHLQVIRGRASVPRIVFYGLAIPSKCLSLSHRPSKCIPRPPASSFCSSKG